MARECIICEKKSMMVWKRKKLRGRYNPTVKRRKYPNLQWATIPMGINRPAYKEYIGKRIKICAKCIKTMSKRK